jgi:hypothetical protein
LTGIDLNSIANDHYRRDGGSNVCARDDEDWPCLVKQLADEVARLTKEQAQFGLNGYMARREDGEEVWVGWPQPREHETQNFPITDAMAAAAAQQWVASQPRYVKARWAIQEWLHQVFRRDRN